MRMNGRRKENRNKTEENIYEEPRVTAASRLKPPVYCQDRRNNSQNNVDAKSKRFILKMHEQGQAEPINGVYDNEKEHACAQLLSQVPASLNSSFTKRSMIPTLVKPPCNSRTSQHSVERIQSRPLPLPQQGYQRKSWQTEQSPVP